MGNLKFKNLILALLVLILSFTLIACKKDKVEASCEISVNDKEISLQLGETYDLDNLVKNVTFNNYDGSLTDYVLNYEVDNTNVCVIDGKVIKSVEGGKATITITVEGVKGSEIVIVNVTPISFVSEDSLIVGSYIRFTPLVGALVGQVTYTSSDETIAKVEANVLTGLKEGVVTITMTCENHTFSKEISVEPITVTNINLDNDNYVLKVNAKVQLNASIEPLNCDSTLSYTSSNSSVISVSESGLVSALGVGEAFVLIKANDKVGFEKSVKIEVKDGGKATVNYDKDYNEKVYLNWGKDPVTAVTKGLSVIDSVYGDITDKFEIEGDLNNQVRGEYKIKLVYDDGSDELIKIDRTVDVVWNYEVEFIGHAGSYFGIANTEQAFLYAAKELHYTAIECDLKRTKDGVFVMCHDDTFGGKTISSLTYEELSKVTATGSRTAGYPKQYGMLKDGEGQYSSKICTLERYLEICKEYNCLAIIELKSCAGVTNTDQSGMQALMNVIEKCDMLDSVAFLGSAYNCLIWTRNNGYGQIPCQYLVNSLDSQTALDRCNQYDLDISTNVTNDPPYANSEEWIAKYKEAGHKVSVWTFTQYVDYPVVQSWIDKGVDYVTCDWQKMDMLRLPEKGDYTETVKHTVKFYDYDGSLLKETKVIDGKTAAGPTNPKRNGYVFTEWDKPITNVTTDLDVVALYRATEYTVTFDKNLYKEEVTTWANKEDFVNDLYTDIYNWFKTQGTSSKVGGVTVENDKVTISKNSVTVSFSNVSELRAIDIYDFEKTVSNYMYKPVTRASDGSITLLTDENYILNSQAYKTKYQELDKVIYETCVTNYSSYDRTYTPTAAGKIQIFFRFHQWTKGTNISTLNKYFPAASQSLIKKYVVSEYPGLTCEMPEAYKYTVDSEGTIPTPVSNIEFLGWYDNKDCIGDPITSVKGYTKNMTLYAKWKITE